MAINQPTRENDLPEDISIRMEGTTTYGSHRTPIKPPDEAREHGKGTWKDAVYDTSITNTLILASFLLGIRIMSYHEKPSGDDNPIGRSLDHFFGRLLFPSTSGLVLTIIVFIPLNCAIFYRLRHCIIILPVLTSIFGRLVGLLVVHGPAEFWLEFGCSFLVAAFACQVWNGIEWLVGRCWRRRGEELGEDGPLLGQP